MDNNWANHLLEICHREGLSDEQRIAEIVDFCEVQVGLNAQFKELDKDGKDFMKGFMDLVGKDPEGSAAYLRLTKVEGKGIQIQTFGDEGSSIVRNGALSWIRQGLIALEIIDPPKGKGHPKKGKPKK